MGNERLEFDVIVNGKKARAEIKTIERDTESLEKRVKKSNSTMSDSWIELGLKITAASLAMKASIAAYEKQFKAETALGAAMKNNESLHDTNIDNWKEYASAIQEWSNVGDEAVLQQLAFLNTLGLSDGQMKSIIQTAADLSNATGMSLDSAVRNLSKSLSGLSGELGEMFPQLRDLTAEQLKAGEGIKVIAEAVKGQSQAIANSPVGKWNALWNAAGDTFEKVGEKILGILDSIRVLEFGTIVFEQLAFGMDLLGLRFEWIGQKVKEFWNVLTFDTEEANKAQSKALEIEEKYIKLLGKSKDALAGRNKELDESSIMLDAQAEAMDKVTEAEMNKVYADELAALGLDAQGEELDKVNEKLKETVSYYDDARYAVDDYANSINSLTQTLSASEQQGGGTGVYKTVITEPGEYVDKTFYDHWAGFLTPGFASGGYTGDAGVNQVAGVVHGQEYVVNAQTTKDLGLNNSSGVFNEMDQKLGQLSFLYDMNKTLKKLLAVNKSTYERLNEI